MVISLTSSEYEPFNSDEEREDVYRKLKDIFNFLASIIDDKNVGVVHRIRAAHIIPDHAKTLRAYLLDWEKLDELEKKLKELKKRLA